MNNTVTEMNNTLEEINNRITEAEESISDLEGRMQEIIVTEQNIVKKGMRKNEDSLWDLWYNSKHINICMIGVPEGEEKKDLRKYWKR